MPQLGPVKFLTVHCAATPEGRHVTHEQITQWDKAKFGQTNYHWVVETNAATTIQLRSTQSAGTLTPQAGSFMRATKVL
jgi:hypothetical protein